MWRREERKVRAGTRTLADPARRKGNKKARTHGLSWGRPPQPFDKQSGGLPRASGLDDCGRLRPYTYRIKAINEYGVSKRSRRFHTHTPAAP